MVSLCCSLEEQRQREESGANSQGYIEISDTLTEGVKVSKEILNRSISAAGMWE